jgi:hypothetical protein
VTTGNVGLLSISEYTVEQETDDSKCNPNENSDVVDNVERSEEGSDEYYGRTIGWKSTCIHK